MKPAINAAFYAVIVVLGLALSACQFFGPNTAEQTLVAQNYVLNTEIAAIRATATVESDRMMMTLEFSGTSVARVNGQTDDLSATLMARGTVSVDTSAITPNIPLVITTPPPILNLGPAPITPISITPGNASAQTGASDASGATLPQTTPLAPAADAGGPLSNIVTSASVGSDDCATEASTTFTTQDVAIYVVATANGIGPDDEVGSTWYSGSEQVADYHWTPSFEINGACIWFFIDQSDVSFAPGTWRVQMELNGSPVGSAAVFSIVEADPPGDAMLEGALSGQ